LSSAALIDAMADTRDPAFLELFDRLSSPAIDQTDLTEDTGFSPAVTFDDRRSKSGTGGRKEGPPIFFSIPTPVDEGKCELLYSDIYFRALHVKQTVDSKLTLDTPSEASNHTFTVSLIRPSAVDQVQVGWGFELVRWEGESVVRVGRVILTSPVARAGIRSGDILLSVNGMPPQTMASPAALTCAILSLPNDFRSHLSVFESMKSVVSDANLVGKANGPVVLRLQSTRDSAPRTAGESIRRAAGSAAQAAAHSLQPSFSPLRPAPRRPSDDGGIPSQLTQRLESFGSNASSLAVHQPDRQGVQDRHIAQDLEPLPVAPADNSLGRDQMHENGFVRERLSPSGHVGPEVRARSAGDASREAIAALRASRPMQANIQLPAMAGRPGPYKSSDPDVQRVLEALKSKYFGRPRPLDVGDLYLPGLDGTFLTLLETSLLLVSNVERAPLVGTKRSRSVSQCIVV
jgi:hypothetical protein